MKRSVLILLLISACSLLLAQTWQRSYPWQDVCQEEYNNASADVYNVIPAIGGGYLMQGYAVFAYNSPNIDILIMMTDIFWKIAENGDVVWRRTTYEWGEPYNAIASNGVDRYYALYGNDGNSLFVVYDEELNVVTSLSFPSQYGINNPLEDMVVVDDGLVFAGRRSNAYGWFLMKIDFDYNLLWTKELNIDFHDYGCEKLKNTNDGGFLGNSTRAMIRFDSAGDTLWTCNGDMIYILDCLQTTNNNYNFFGLDDFHGLYDIYQFDAVSQTIITITDGIPYAVFDGIQSIKEASDGNIILLNRSTEGKLHKYTQQGEHIWSREFPLEYSGYFSYGTKNLICTDAGDIVFCMGEIGGDLYLVKADSMGNVVAINDPINPTPEVQLSHYPNPVSSNTKIIFNVKEQIRNLKLEIFNIRGQKLFSSNLNAKTGEFIWDGHGNDSELLSNGVYIYSIKSGDTILKSSKMIIIH